ncbi:peptidase M23 [Bacillus sp. FJAT-18019]|nr:peptidase M23 [Bacillus sp. FJAT-18019]
MKINRLAKRGTIYRWIAGVTAGITAAFGLCGPVAASVPSASDTVTKEVSAAGTAEPDTIFANRKSLYEQVSTLTQIPWYRLAAIDQYERTLTRVHPKDRKHPERMLGIFIPQARWAGPLNPNQEDTDPTSINVFSGIGLDGDGDGKADSNNDTDLLYTVATRLAPYGHAADDFSIGLWSYYQNTRAVQRVMQYAKLYETFGKLDLFDHAFPLPVKSNYSYRSTFGMGRNWGGRRVHEGTDLFAHYGVPVRSTCYGVVEIKGWNKYGGWRIGIRDLNNHYHYYAHLQGFDKGITLGDVVKPGQTLGWVGSSGYGKPGTQGKFPPHLHYGIYRDTGLTEWAFDPFPLLKHWETEEKRSKK